MEWPLMKIIGVKKPVFRLHKPGQDTHYTTRPYNEAIQTKIRKSVETLPGTETWSNSPYNPTNLSTVSDQEFYRLMGNASTDMEHQMISNEVKRRFKEDNLEDDPRLKPYDPTDYE